MDRDVDGPCDGGRAAACTWPGGDGTSFHPGEADYGSTPWQVDSDDDGPIDLEFYEIYDPVGDERKKRDLESLLPWPGPLRIKKKATIGET